MSFKNTEFTADLKSIKLQNVTCKTFTRINLSTVPDVCLSEICSLFKKLKVNWEESLKICS